MCRHLAYLGIAPISLAELLTAPPGSLYEQSWAPRKQQHGTVNADGFGIGWYPGDPHDGGEPARYRRALPIWNDRNLPELTAAISSTAVLAAVRSATPGSSPDEAVTAPYRSGRWLFSHNGAVDAWERLPQDLGPAAGAITSADLLAGAGRCDSALLWTLLARALNAGRPPVDAVAQLVTAVAAVRPAARLNLLLTDGDTVIATRHGDSLWYAQTPGRVLVASEPTPGLTSGGAGDWREIPESSLVLATRAGVRSAPLPPGPAAGPGRGRARSGAHAPAPEPLLTVEGTNP
ncbi:MULTISPECIES: ergothioneine biosynthesis protein EgtC [Streptomyces]|uniref:ergothioneine biosynthesis protein EgtC n=1 Tax=Streptomyces TaxID=1883 RepID=UPI001903722B|nr:MULTISPECIES: ergothioneine biosynthesis protein EgtC [unclassified Streptomyces]MCU4749189.1 ergothioneine biosynthesis protein EgtC [Streptomyces sp. G-5]QQN77268.1 ergothioneine biosynthesis protein EgtC [Streptomyces sp. XC 2026]